jgi:hypothetical protein
MISCKNEYFQEATLRICGSREINAAERIVCEALCAYRQEMIRAGKPEGALK